MVYFLFQGVRERSNLTGTPELGLKNAITHRENVDDYGHLVYEALKKVGLLLVASQSGFNCIMLSNCLPAHAH